MFLWCWPCLMDVHGMMGIFRRFSGMLLDKWSKFIDLKPRLLTLRNFKKRLQRKVWRKGSRKGARVTQKKNRTLNRKHAYAQNLLLNACHSFLSASYQSTLSRVDHFLILTSSKRHVRRSAVHPRKIPF